MTKESYNLYVYFSMQFYSYLKLKWPGTVGEKYPPKRKRRHTAYFNYSKLHWRSEIIPDTLNCANPILHGASSPNVFLTTLMNRFMTLILIYRASKPVMFGLLGCLVYHRKELVKEYLMFSELIVPNVSL